MKKLILFLALLCPVFAHGAANEIITATIAITNAPTLNGQTITVNGNTRTWTNSVVVPASQILTNLTIGGSATNLFLQVAASPYAGLSLGHNGGVGITLQTAPGGALSVSFSAGYASVVLSTQTLVSAVAVRAPYTVEVANQQTNITSAVVKMISALQNTNQIDDFSLAATNLVGINTTQTVAGAKSLTNQFNLYKGNSTDIKATNTFLYGDTWFSNVLKVVIVPGEGILFYDPVADAYILGLTNGGVTIGANSFFRVESGTPALNKLLHADSSGNATWAYLAGVTNTAVRGAYFDATNTFPAGSDVAFGRYALTTLANGNNSAIPVLTNVFVEVSGPSDAFFLNGIAGGRDGKFLIILNRTGFAMTVKNDSGVDPVPANRIYTLQGVDRSSAGDCAAMFIYSAAASRWILLSLDGNL